MNVLMHRHFFGVGIVHWIVFTILALLLISWVIVQEEGRYATNLQYISNEHIERVALDPNCDLRAGPCITVLENGARVSLGIEPRSIPVAETLNLEVRVEGHEVESIEVDINGVNMKMPLNRRRLDKIGHGLFSGQAGLMFCTRSAMEWEMVVELNTQQGQIHVPFRFITVTNGQI